VDERPITRYATAPDGVSLAYQVFGDGPVDLLWIPNVSYPIDLLWDDPGFAHFARRLRGFSHAVWVEGRGLGASGGDLLDALDPEIMNGDLIAVLDAARCERVAVVGSGISGLFAMNFALAHPTRVANLVLIEAFAHYMREPDYQVGFVPTVLDQVYATIRQTWGTAASVEIMAPSKAEDPTFRERMARCERLGHSPERVAETVRRTCESDLRPVLGTLSVPTLVLHRRDDRFIRVEAGRYVGEHIPGAKYVELPGEDHLSFVGDVDVLMDEVEEFLTGGHQAVEGDVVTTTILFTDIVASTEQAAKFGHRAWTQVTDAHDAMVRGALQRHRGHEVKTIGDGFLATFDSTSRAVRAAMDIVKLAKAIGIEVRAGVHTGEVELRTDDVVGLAVSITKRVCDLAGRGQVYVSEAVKSVIVDSGIAVIDEGGHVLKGVPGERHLYRVEGP